MPKLEAPRFGQQRSESEAFQQKLVGEAQAGKTTQLPVFGVYGEGEPEYEPFQQRYNAVLANRGVDTRLSGVGPVHIEIPTTPVAESTRPHMGVGVVFEGRPKK